jgi:1,4-alpha-glucan branching enzyme
MIACLTNFSSEPRSDYRIGLPAVGVWKEILNTDASVYDGTGQIGNLGQVVAVDVPSHGYDASARVTIPPLGAVWLSFEPEPTEEHADPAAVTAGTRAAAKAVSPTVSTAPGKAGGALTDAEQSGRARPTSPPRATVQEAAPTAPKAPAGEIGPDGGLTRSLEDEDDPQV